MMEHAHKLNVDYFVNLSFDEQNHTAHHPEHRLALLTQGVVEMVYGSNITIAAPALIMIPPGIPHRPLKAEGADMYLVSFCISCLGIDEDSLLMQPSRQVRDGAFPAVSVAPNRLPLLIQVFEALSTESQQSGAESTPLLRSYLSIIFGDLYRAMTLSNDQHPISKLASEALRFIHQNCHNAISLKEVAAAVHRVSPHVATVVKKRNRFHGWRVDLPGKNKESFLPIISQYSVCSGSRYQVRLERRHAFYPAIQKKVTGHTPAQWRKKHAMNSNN